MGGVGCGGMIYQTTFLLFECRGLIYQAQLFFM